MDGGGQADYKQHSVAHTAVRQLAGNQQVQNAEMLQNGIKANDDDQCPGHTTELHPGILSIGKDLVTQFFNDPFDIPQG